MQEEKEDGEDEGGGVWLYTMFSKEHKGEKKEGYSGSNLVRMRMQLDCLMAF